MHLGRLFQRTVAKHGAGPALVQGDGAPLTYAALDLRVRRLARALTHDHGLVAGDRVLLAMANSTAYAEALLAIWTAGLCAVPVNHKLHPQEVAHVLQDAGARLCLSSGAVHEALRPGVGTALLDVGGPAWCAAASAGEALPGVPASAQEDDLAWLFYTSGTTGRPKGVMLTHAHLVAMSLAFYADVLDVCPGDALVHAAPMSHGSGLYGICWMLRGGLQVVPASGGFDEAELLALPATHGRASFFAAPTMIHRLVAHVQGLGRPAGTDPCPGLRCIVAGGAPFYVEDIKAAVAAFGPRIAQIYGQGETPMTISALDAAQVARAVAGDDDALLASVGHPHTPVELEIRHVDGSAAAVGEMGEVAVRSPTVMRGYWNNAEATAKTLVQGWLLTGDVGLVDGRGLLHLKDRSKDVIISGGSNIYPREVEEALLRHPAVAEVSVVGVRDAEWGESVVAVVVLRAGSEAQPEALDAVCLERIARFKRPRRYVFVDRLPKNATGKVLKGALRELVGSGAVGAAGDS